MVLASWTFSAALLLGALIQRRAAAKSHDAALLNALHSQDLADLNVYEAAKDMRQSRSMSDLVIEPILDLVDVHVFNVCTEHNSDRNRRSLSAPQADFLPDTFITATVGGRTCFVHASSADALPSSTTDLMPVRGFVVSGPGAGVSTNAAALGFSGIDCDLIISDNPCSEDSCGSDELAAVIPGSPKEKKFFGTVEACEAYCGRLGALLSSLPLKDGRAVFDDEVQAALNNNNPAELNAVVEKLESNNPWTHGEKRVLAMMVRFQDEAPDAEMPLSFRDAGFAIDVVSRHVETASYGALTLVPTVVPEFIDVDTTIGEPGELEDHPDSCHVNGIYEQARARALELGYDTAEYELDVLIFNGRDCYFNGGYFSGLASVGGKDNWINFSPEPGGFNDDGSFKDVSSYFAYETYRVLVHEFGHNLGLNHAGNKATDIREHEGYGDGLDMMGSFSGTQTGDHFNVAYKHKLGWLPESSIERVGAVLDYTNCADGELDWPPAHIRSCEDYGIRRGCAQAVGGSGCYCDDDFQFETYFTPCQYGCNKCDPTQLEVGALPTSVRLYPTDVEDSTTAGRRVAIDIAREDMSSVWAELRTVSSTGGVNGGVTFVELASARAKSQRLDMVPETYGQDDAALFEGDSHTFHISADISVTVSPGATALKANGDVESVEVHLAWIHPSSAPSAPPTDLPSTAPTVLPTTASPTSTSPSAAPTTATPTTPTEGTCRKQTRKARCQKKKKICAWDGANQVCVVKTTAPTATPTTAAPTAPTAAPTTATPTTPTEGTCRKQTQKARCQKKKKICAWDGANKVCVVKTTASPTPFQTRAPSAYPTAFPFSCDSQRVKRCKANRRSCDASSPNGLRLGSYFYFCELNDARCTVQGQSRGTMECVDFGTPIPTGGTTAPLP